MQLAPPIVRRRATGPRSADAPRPVPPRGSSTMEWPAEPASAAAPERDGPEAPASTPLGVLILEDCPDDAELILGKLREAGFSPVWQRVETEADYLDRLGPGIDVVLAAYTLPRCDALRAWDHLQERALDVPFIVVGGAIGEEVAVECIKRGAADYLLRDRLDRLGQAVRRALEEKQVRQEKREAEAALRESETR